MYGYIYKTTNLINGKVYIGQHKSKRFDRNYYGSGILIAEAIKKYGKENFKIELVEECNSKEELNDAEIYWIKKFDAVNNDNYYNIALGGYTQPILTDESHKKQSQTLKKHYADGTITPPMLGKHFTETQKLKISQATKLAMNSVDMKLKLKGNRLKRTEEQCCEISKRFKGVSKTPEHKEKIRKALLGVPLTEQRKKKISEANRKGQHARGNNPRAKKIICIDTGEIFECSTDAGEKYNCNAKSIRNCCNGKYKTAGGLRWKWFLEK